MHELSKESPEVAELFDRTYPSILKHRIDGTSISFSSFAASPVHDGLNELPYHAQKPIGMLS